MKKIILLILLLNSLQSVTAFQSSHTFDVNYWDKTDYSLKAKRWFNNYARYLSPSSKRILAQYAASRIQEINAWLFLERTDLNKFQNKIARIQHWDALNRKQELEASFHRYPEISRALNALRNAGNEIASDKFTSELISSFFQYRSGKRAAAKTAKMSFYTYCWSLLLESRLLFI